MSEIERWPELKACKARILPETPYTQLKEVKGRAADPNDAEGAALMVQAYYRGDIVRHNKDKAVESLLLAVEKGHPLSLYFEAFHKERGLDGKPRDPEDAPDAWRKALKALLAVENPSGHVLDAICMIYSSGRANEGDPELEKAWSFCQKACAAEPPLPQPRVRRGWFHENGKGGAEKSDRLAYQSYKEAARLGSSLANHHLARCYLEGVGVEEDRETALGYLTRAAEKGVPNATKDLENIIEKNLNFLGGGRTRTLVKDSQRKGFRFEVGERILVTLEDQEQARWEGEIVERRTVVSGKSLKYKVRIESLETSTAATLKPCPCTGQEEIDNEGTIKHVWIPEECAERPSV